jgi:hypothetical protein
MKYSLRLEQNDAVYHRVSHSIIEGKLLTKKENVKRKIRKQKEGWKVKRRV